MRIDALGFVLAAFCLTFAADGQIEVDGNGCKVSSEGVAARVVVSCQSQTDGWRETTSILIGAGVGAPLADGVGLGLSAV